jgi:hypothetical protein
MKILFVSPSYYPAIGGVETQARLIAQEWLKSIKSALLRQTLVLGIPNMFRGG